MNAVIPDIEFGSDADLLQRFVAGGSEEAFRSLVSRYFNLVFGLAMRRTGRRDFAEDVAQKVFIELARHAPRLDARPTLGGWLYRCAMNESADAIRRDGAYQRKMKAYSETSATQPATPAALDAALPHLDDALGALPARDRDLLILRFFEGRSFREIGAALGKSDDAAQKHCDRALQRLAARLARVGVAVPASALAAGLSGHLSHVSMASGAAVIERISRNAVSRSTAVAEDSLLSRLMNTASRSPRLAAALVAVTAAVPISILWMENNRLKDRIAALSGTVGIDAAPATPASAGAPHARIFARAGSAAASNPTAGAGSAGDPCEYMNSWRSALTDADPVRRAQRIAALLRDLTKDNAFTVAEVFRSLRAQGRPFDSEYHLFSRSWGALDGPAAVKSAEDLAHQNVRDAGVLAAVAGWASVDPSAARDWIEKLGDDPGREDAITGLIDGWSMTDFASAAAYAESRPRSTARDAFRQLLLERSLDAGGLPAAQDWFNGIPNDEHNALYKQRAFDEVVQAMLYRDPSAAAQWIASQSSASYAAGSALVQTAAKLAESAPAEALQWVASLKDAPAAAANPAYGAAMAAWAGTDPAAAGAWLAQNPGNPAYDTMAAQYAQSIAKSSPDSAVAWAGSLQDPALREQATIQVASAVVGQLGDQADSTLRSAGLTDSQIAQARNGTISFIQTVDQAQVLSVNHAYWSVRSPGIGQPDGGDPGQTVVKPILISTDGSGPNTALQQISGDTVVLGSPSQSADGRTYIQFKPSVAGSSGAGVGSTAGGTTPVVGSVSGGTP
jgi:RNA polymerase sigma factor (sigma-70 family)